ncbi:uncharacterized protein LOC117505257 [Thalassophryne amazonica]|uniref:uncharacterized protein LOC117505257 n=1 Tax=Thalassophryne amazonica TaxID=390379 RepID=UPI00147180E2|nr:uncharacterized protein LOC117505257 [Thalassophryne amazonica]
MHLYTALCVTLHLSAVTQSSTVVQDTGVTSSRVGDNVTLRCFCRSEVVTHFFWYHQRLGRAPKLLSNIYKYDLSQQKIHQLQANPRYFVHVKQGMNNLHISNVQCGDSAMYFCGTSHSNTAEFGDGVFLQVQETEPVDVVQEPVSKFVLPGDSVTFNCTVLGGTCDGQHSVYWLRHSTLTTYNHKDQCRNVSTPASPAQNNIYYFQMMNLSSSDAGTYYCAVSSCGEIRFGSGTKLHVGEDPATITAQIKILLHLSVIRVVVMLCVVIVCLLVYIWKRSHARRDH